MKHLFYVNPPKGAEPAKMVLRRCIHNALNTMHNHCEGAVAPNYVHKDSTLVLTYVLHSPAYQPLMDKLNNDFKKYIEVSEDSEGRLRIVFRFADPENLGVQSVEDSLVRLRKTGRCDKQSRIHLAQFDKFHKS